MKFGNDVKLTISRNDATGATNGGGIFLVPKLHLGTHLLRQFHCRSRATNQLKSARNEIWEREKVAW